MVTKYDPLNPMPKGEWLALDEQDRHDAVEEFHEGHDPLPPSLSAHVAFHVIVENQLAESIDCVERTVARLMREGLDRHDAIHAVGSVLAEQLNEMMKRRRKFELVSYARSLDRLTARAWLKGI